MLYGVEAASTVVAAPSAPPGGPLPPPGAVHFAGGIQSNGPTFLTIASLATGADTGLYSFSFWSKGLCDIGNQTGSCRFLAHDPDTNYDPNFYEDNAGKLGFEFAHSGNYTPLLNALSSGWKHLIGSVDVNHASGSRVAAFYVNRVLQSPSIAADFGIAVINLCNGKKFVFGDDSFGVGPECDFADVWIAPGVSLLTGSTISTPTLDLFNNAGSPADPAGFPSGAVLFTGDAANFAHNFGTGGSAVLTGTLTNASTLP